MYSAHPNIFRTVKFKYAGLPSWFNVNDRAGEYAWKPLIIKEVRLGKLVCVTGCLWA